MLKKKKKSINILLQNCLGKIRTQHIPMDHVYHPHVRNFFW